MNIIKLKYSGPVCGVNRRYMIARGKMILSRQYRFFIDSLTLCFFDQKHEVRHRWIPYGKVSVVICLWLPKRMDSDALLKPIFDALQHGGIIADDNQIQKYYVIKNDHKGESRIEIEVKKIKG